MITVIATDINDAFHQLLYKFTETDESGNYKNVYITEIDAGSFGKEKLSSGEISNTFRLQAEMTSIEVLYPETRPLSIQYPEQLGIPRVNSDEVIEDYFVDYLANGKISSNETYTYGSRMNNYFTKCEHCGNINFFNQIDWIVEHFKKFPNNNHCCVQIAKGDDVTLEHAPCARSVSFKIVDKKLNMMLFFRSWDLYSGLPTNLGGFQLLNELIASRIGLKTGKLFGVSDGLHIYSYSLPVIKQRLGR